MSVDSTRAKAHAVARHNDAVAAFRDGRPGEARAFLLDAIRVLGPADVDVRTLKFLWECGRRTGDWKTALAAGTAASRRDPLDFRLANDVLTALRDCALQDLPPGPACRLPAQALPSLTIVVVSQDDHRFARADRELTAAFAAWPHERVRIKGAISMYDGYTRGLAATRADYVVFAHDDIEIAVPDFAARLHDAMATADMVGVAGTTRVSGPGLLWSGHPWLRGAITHKAPADAAYEFAVTSFDGPRVAAQGLDGVFICARRQAACDIGFDTARFDGFHFYDLDFSYRAFRAGARVAIAADLGLIHASRGRVDDGYLAAASRFQAKFPDLAEPTGQHRHWYAASLPDREAVRRMYEKLFAVWAVDVTQLG